MKQERHCYVGNHKNLSGTTCLFTQVNTLTLIKTLPMFIGPPCEYRFFTKLTPGILSIALFVASVSTVCATGEADSAKVHDVSKEIMKALNNAVPAGTTFTEVVSLPGVIYGGMEWGDYDNDNDLDVVVTGNQSDPNSPTGFAKIYKNNGGAFTEDTNNTLQQVASGSVDWADYDRDGDIDLLLTGFIPAEPTRPTTFVYTNVNGVLSELPNVVIPGVTQGSCHWVDWDNDGDLDIFITGWTFVAENTVSYIAKFYRNNNGAFEAFQYNVEAAYNGDVAWNDVDGDRDFDLLVTGGGDYAKLWLNNVEDGFSSTVSLEGLSSSSTAWGDFDNDGDQDLIISGTKDNSDVGTVILYKNTPAGLVSAGASGLTAHYESSMSTGDYDNDGDLDVLLTGFTSPFSPTNTSLFNNNGTGNFTLASNAGLTTPVRNGESTWGDYDNDGDLDLILCGSNATWDVRYTKIYRNDLNTTNMAPGTPTGLTSSQTGTEVIFSWNAATDPQGGTVSYNLRIGTTPGGSEIMSASSDLATGFHRIAKPGNVKNGLSWRIKNLTAARYYWSVQAIDNSYKAGSFSPEAQTVIQFPAAAFKAEPDGYQQVTLSWINLNTTGHFVIYRESNETLNPTNIIAANVSGTSFIDTNVTNNNTYYYYIKAADSNGNSSALASANAMSAVFTEVQSFTYVQYGASAWGDYDADGDYDVVVTGYQAPDPAVEFFKNANGTFTKEQGPALVSGELTRASWNDYDNDNDLDLLITGVTEPSGRLYKNTGGIFSAVSNTNLPVLSGWKPAWADFDNDGDTDVGIPRSQGTFLLKNNKADFSQSVALPFSHSMAWGDHNNDGDMDYALGDGLYDNVDGVFTKHSTFNSYGAVAWADIDNDGDLDLVASSLANSTKVVTYRNDAGVFTAVDQPGMVPFFGGDLSPASISAGDYDNDGDVDLLVTGITSSSPYITGASIYINNGSGIFSKDQRVVLPQAGGANASWGDYDRDGDLDVLIYGIAASQSSDGYVNKVFRNNLNDVNHAPTVPSGLQATFSDSRITFTWNTVTDSEGGPVTYNLRVGTTPGGSEIMSAMANVTTGQLLVPAMGNVQLNRSWTLNGINAGTYYWSVQAIDGTFRESAFAAEEQIVLNSQTITFAEPGPVVANQTPFNLNASASSALPVAYTSSNTSVATISGNQVTVLSAGTTNITASQPGNNSFAAATPVTRVLTVSKIDQTVAFSELSSRTVGDAPFTLPATASSALPVQYSTTSDKITLSGNTVTIVKAGSATITAKQDGNENYNSATGVSQTFCINPAKPTVTLSGADSENTLLISSATTGNQWYLNDTAIPLATQSTWHPVTAGVYTVMTTVDGCSSELSDQVSLIVTGVLETPESKIKMYPNPATSQLIIELPAESHSCILQLLHPDGSVLQTLETTQQTVEWELHGLAAGLYIVRVKHIGKTEHHKLVKR